MILETPRLWLREYEMADWTAVLEYQSDPRYLRYYPWMERSQADVRAFIQMFIDQQGERPRTKYQLAVILKTTGNLIGSCGLRVDDPERQKANIGYELDPQQWGRGYATEAARAILFFGFETLGLERIWAETIAENKGSIRVLEKIGLRVTLREPDKKMIKGVWQDNLIYSVNTWDWDERPEP